jgi:hypothetical protein
MNGEPEGLFGRDRGLLDSLNVSPLPTRDDGPSRSLNQDRAGLLKSATLAQFEHMVRSDDDRSAPAQPHSRHFLGTAPSKRVDSFKAAPKSTWCSGAKQHFEGPLQDKSRFGNDTFPHVD